MDNSEFQQRVKRLKEVNDVIKDLDPAIKEGALPLLADYVIGRPIAPKVEQQSDDGSRRSPGKGAGEFFARFPEGKPSDNAISIAAYVYSQYGAEPFKIDDIRETAKSVGLTIPSSLDMTFKQAQRRGKLLFQHTGRSEFKPTVSGEIHFKETYQVPKGTKRRPVQGSES